MRFKTSSHYLGLCMLFVVAGCASNDSSITCSLEDQGEGTMTISCSDGTQVTVRDGEGCTVTDNGDETATISCPDGTEVTIHSGQEGPQGPAGQDGQDGQDGDQGPQGPAGQDGQDGEQGPQGPAGQDGQDGEQGPQGPAGQDGQDGEQGPQGPAGADGQGCTVADNDDGTATITCDDGSTSTFDSGCTRKAHTFETWQIMSAHCPGGRTVVFGGERVPLRNATPQLAGTDELMCMLNEAGAAQCWSNWYGFQGSPPPGFVQIATDGYETCGLRADGTALCWHTWGSETTERPGPFVQLSMGRNEFLGLHGCGLRTNGTIECWHYSSSQTLPPAHETFVQLASGTFKSCGLRADGTVLCWGEDSSGPFVTPAEEKFVQIAVGSFQACGLRPDGSVRCWGETGPDLHGETFVSLSSGSGYVCGMRPYGEALCWTSFDTATFSPPDEARPLVQLAVGNRRSCGLRSDGAVLCWFNATGEPMFPSVLVGSCVRSIDGADEPTQNTQPGLFYELWRNRPVEVLPDFDQLGSPDETGTLTTVGLPASEANQDNFVLRLTGWIYLDESLRGLLELASDDGSRLFIDDELFVDNDGVHGREAKYSPQTCFAPGWYRLRIEFFELGGAAALQLAFKTSSGLTAFPAGALYH
jgi:hypothetical protein